MRADVAIHTVPGLSYEQAAVHRAVSDALVAYGLDRANPFGALVRPGQTIVIKPNLVMHEVGPLVGAHCLCTDGAVIRAVIDFATKAVGSTGKVIVADVPLQGADFGKLVGQLGLDRIREEYRALGYDVELRDLRTNWAVLSDDGQIVRDVALAGDPLGYTTIDLGDHSFLDELARGGARFGITDYDEHVTNAHHRAGKHEYMLANTALFADAVINVPKLKMHQKAGLTAAMKNFVGINGSKDYLAHHRVGAPARGGDEFPVQTWFNVAFREVRRALNGRAPGFVWRAARRIGLAMRDVLASQAKPVTAHGIGAGGWYGNETIWRTIYDINRAFFFYDVEARVLAKTQQRKYLAIVDGIVAGEGEGPLRPTPAPLGAIVVGESPLAVDLACARVMGLDPARIPFLREHARIPELPVGDALTAPIRKLQPPRAWRGHVEL